MDAFDDVDRELDDSYEEWYRNIGTWVMQKEDMTQVPHENVYDSAANVEADAEEEQK